MHRESQFIPITTNKLRNLDNLWEGIYRSQPLTLSVGKAAIENRQRDRQIPKMHIIEDLDKNKVVASVHLL